MKNYVAIEAKNIVTQFGQSVIHDEVSFKIQRGEIFGLLGGSGSGKTTLLREMIMLQKTSGGQMLVLGTDVMKISSKMAQKLRQKCVLGLHAKLLAEGLSGLGFGVRPT